MIEAVGYLRVSGSGQLKGDGFTRQEKNIRKYAKQNNLTITKIYKEEAVKGKEYIRPALTDLYLDIEHKKDQVIIIEKLDRLARDLMVQEQIVCDMRKKNMKLISTFEGHDLLGNDPTRKLMRQIMGAFSEYEKEMIIQKLAGARERKKKETGKCEGRKSYQETNPEVLEEIKRLRRKPRNGNRLSLKKTVDALNSTHMKTQQGLEFTVGILKKLNHTYKLTT